MTGCVWGAMCRLQDGGLEVEPAEDSDLGRELQALYDEIGPKRLGQTGETLDVALAICWLRRTNPYTAASIEQLAEGIAAGRVESLLQSEPTRRARREPGKGERMKTIDVAKFGSGNVFHVLAQEHKRGTLVDGREDHDAIALCGKTGTKSRVERRLDARAIAHDGVAICGNCRPYIAFSEIDPEGDTHKSAEKTAGKGADSMPRKTKDATIASTTKGRARAAAKKSGAKPRKPLDESGERKVLRLAKKLAKDGVDETGATIYGRKLLKLKSGLRTSLPPIPSSLDRADAEKVEKGIGVERARREKVEA